MRRFLFKYPSGRYADRAPPDCATRHPPPRPDAQSGNPYQSAERIGTKKAYEDFLFDYPSGRYADRARDQIARLTPPPPPRRPLGWTIPPSPSSTGKYGPIPTMAPPITSAASSTRSTGIRECRQGFRRSHPARSEGCRGVQQPLLGARHPGRAAAGDEGLRQALEIRPRYLDALDSRGFVNLKIGQHEQRHRRLRRGAADQSEARLGAVRTRNSQAAQRQYHRRQRRHRRGETDPARHRRRIRDLWHPLTAASRQPDEMRCSLGAISSHKCERKDRWQ